MPISNTPSSLSKQAQAFYTAFKPMLSAEYLDKLEAVCQAVTHEEISARPGFQQGDGYIWSCAVFLDNNLKPVLDKKHQVSWNLIFTFLKEAIGNDVIAQENMFENSMKAWTDLQYKHGFKTVWSMSNYKEMPPDIENEIFPMKGIEKLYYHPEYSGYGALSSVDLPKNATYLDVWRAADKLIVDSGDTHHIFIEQIINISRLNGKDEYVIVTGS